MKQGNAQGIFHKFAILLFALSCIALPGTSQDTLNVQDKNKQAADGAFFSRFSAGVLSGQTFAQFNGKLREGKWKNQPGPVAGLFFNYNLNDYFSLYTGLSYLNLYYRHQRYTYNTPFPPHIRHRISTQPSIMPSPDYAPPENKWDFSFYRVPLQIKFRTLSKIRFELGAGICFSFLDKYDDNGNYNVPHDYLSSVMPTYAYDRITIRNNDWGWLYSAGFSYPLEQGLTLGLYGRLYTGKSQFLYHLQARHQVYELLLKLGYSGFAGSQPKEKSRSPKSSQGTIALTFKSGLSLSNQKDNIHAENYSISPGASGGISFDFRMGEHLSLQTELLYLSKGYNMQDSGQNVFRVMAPRNSSETYQTNTRIQLGYITLPLLINAHFGKTNTFYLNSGFYYAYNLSARTTGTRLREYHAPEIYIREKTKIYDQNMGYFKDHDWGWLAGAGMQFPVFKHYKLDFGLRYDLSFKNAFTGLRYNNAGDTQYKNHALHLFIGLQMPVD